MSEIVDFESGGADSYNYRSWTGYTCPGCGHWVAPGVQQHTCPQSRAFYVSDSQRIATALERIAVALERIAEAGGQ